jgi:putative ABC transport system ATP-binding protein
MANLIEVNNVYKSFGKGESLTKVLSGATLNVEKGEFVSLMGASGSGKSTLLYLIGGLDRRFEGSISICGNDISKMKEKDMSKLRLEKIGFIFQFYNLVQNLTAKENVELAAQICKDPRDAEEVLKQVGLGERMKNFPAQLSGGEQQRVAIARALAKNPKLLLCDEPTGALDYNTGQAVLKLLQDTCRKSGMTVVVITHNSALAAMADRIITVKSGTVESMRLNTEIVDVENIEW